MKSKSVVLFGGSFNPPHLGHLLVIEQAFELIPGVDELWLLPCHNHTFQKPLSPASHRLEMCRLLIAAATITPSPSHSLKLCPLEIDYQTNGSTYETLKLLKSEPDYLLPKMSLDTDCSYQYSFLMGSDQLPVFTQWQHHLALLKQLPFYIYPRAAYPLKPLYSNMTPLTSPTQVITNISSSLIRDRLTKKLSINHLVPASIYTYLTSHALYR